MPTTRKSRDLDPTPEPVVVDPPDGADAPVEPAVPPPPVAPPAAVRSEPAVTTLPGDEPPLSGAAREAALAALLTPPPVTGLVGAAPVPWVPPGRTGNDFAWHDDGDPYLVLCPVYPRVVGDNRARARSGDVVRVRDDERTRTDVAAGYLLLLEE